MMASFDEHYWRSRQEARQLEEQGESHFAAWCLIAAVFCVGLLIGFAFGKVFG